LCGSRAVQGRRCRSPAPGLAELPGAARRALQSYKDGELRMAVGVAAFRTVIEDVKILKGADQGGR